MMIAELIWDLLRVALGFQEKLPRSLTTDEWMAILEETKKQAIVGLCFSGIERLPEEQRPPRETLMIWWGLTRHIMERNALMDDKTIKVWRYFAGKGFMAILLKGQGNARWYPIPHRRQSGDIDIWVTTGHYAENAGKSRKDVIDFVHGKFPNEKANLKHIHFPADEEVMVEVHFQPGLVREYFANRKLQKFFKQEMRRSQNIALTDCKGRKDDVTVPSWNMNAVFQIVHLFDHFMYEGIGMRQIVDYYYFLKAAKMEKSFDAGKVVRVLKDVHLSDFAKAVMWIEQTVLGLEKEFLILEGDERRGRLLLDEIAEGGNFGLYDKRYAKSSNPVIRFWQRSKRSMRFCWQYPLMTLSAPMFYAAQRLWMAKEYVRAR